MGFDCNTCGVLNAIQSQSPDIAMGVDTGGAGDQGMMFGYACDETAELMPLPIMMAHKLVRRLSEVRRAGELDFLRPDGKSQVSVEYVDGAPKRIDAVVVSTQHSDTVSTEELRAEVKKHIIDPVIPREHGGFRHQAIHINPTGRFVIGGPHGDTGLTGRKIIVDTYGGMGRHGGGAFSGKDPDEGGPLGLLHGALHREEHGGGGTGQPLRSAAGLRHRRGRAGFGDGEHVRHRASCRRRRSPQLIRANFPLTPRGIIDHLKLRRPIYRNTAAFGHFGRTEESFSWEATDKAEALREEAMAQAAVVR